LLCDDNNRRFYAYWKVIYEEVSVKSLAKEYEFPKHRLSVSSMSESKESFLDKPRGIESYEELKIDSVFVPVVMCIQTYNSDLDQTRNLLLSLIKLLYTHESDYKRMVHKTIYSLAEFCSYIFYLTHIMIPPYTKLLIPIAGNTIEYNENLINDFPCEADMSIVYLFTLLPIDFIISIWNLLLLESNIIVYTPDPNIYFYITKALFQLMFPLEWKYLFGIVSDLNLVSENTPYIYCVISSMFSDQEEILEKLDRKPYVMFCVNPNGGSPIKGGVKERFLYPYSERLKKELSDLCLTYGVKVDIELPKKDDSLIEFAKDVQMAFFNEIGILLHNLVFAVKEKNNFLKQDKVSIIDIYMTMQLKADDEDQIKYIDKLSKTNTFKDYSMEANKSLQNNYARVKAMNAKRKLPVIEQERVTLNIRRATVLSKLALMIEQALYSEKSNLKGMSSTYPELNSKFEDEWIKDIIGMKSASNSKIGTKDLDNMVESLRKRVDSSTTKKEIIESVDTSTDNNTFHLYGSKGAISFLTKFMEFNNPLIDQKLTEEICNKLSHLNKGNIEEDKDNILMVSNTKCMQFELLQAFLINKYSKKPLKAVKSFIKAFNFVDDVQSCFPMDLFRELIAKLDIKEIRKLLTNSDELGTVIKEVYDSKINRWTKGTVSIIDKKSITPLVIDKTESINYLNNKPAGMPIDKNPNVIISFLLKDLITLLASLSSKGYEAFHLVTKSPNFTNKIERQAAILAVIFSLYLRMTNYSRMKISLGLRMMEML